MFSISQDQKDALKIIWERLKDVSWALTGSVNLCLQGVKINPNDIDIMILQKDGLDRAIKELKQYETAPIYYQEKTNFKSYYGKYRIAGVRVEIICELEHNTMGKWEKNVRITNTILLDVDGIKIPACPLKLEYEAYTALGRFEKAEKIKKFLDEST